MRDLEKELEEARGQADRANDSLRQIPERIDAELALKMGDLVEARALRLTIEKAAEDIKYELYELRTELRLQREP